MISEKISQINALTEAVKRELHDILIAMAPPEQGCFTVMTSEMIKKPWSPTYHDTGHQLRALAAYAVERHDRSLTTIANAYRRVEETGICSAFTGIVFNDKARAALRSILD